MADKLTTLLIELAKRTRNGSFTWDPTATAGVYQASFPRYTLQLSVRRTPIGSEDYVLTILNSEGTVIEQAADTDFANRLQDALPMMSEMYSAARRQALGVDGAIDDILGELSKRDVSHQG
ncbi:MAG TPA: hypothetical protein VN891_08825 [Steroidobacteraceae bacterium]|jgi:hypothetical protein|nr:hypothetical protein [Steroidobacteraceae bacterium]